MAREYETKRLIAPEHTLIPSHIVYENFEGLEKVGSTGTGTDWEAGRDTWFIEKGKYSWRQRPKKTTPAAGDYVYTTFYMPFYIASRIDIDTVFLHQTTNNNVKVRLDFVTSYNTDDIRFAPIVELNCSNGEVKVRDEKGNYQLIDTVSTGIPKGYWTIFGMSIDLRKQEYLLVRVGQYAKRVSGIKFETLAGFYPCPLVDLRTTNVSTDRALTFWDAITIFGYFA